jgi:DNA-binding beta-propeller fold protein YncE
MFLLRIFILVAALLSAACASNGARSAAFKPGSVVWPSAPMPTRLVLAAVIASPEDAGIAKGFWGTVWTALVGEDDLDIMRPYGVYADCRHRLMVVDTGKKGVHLFDKKKGRYAFIGGAKNELFVSPISVTEDMADRLYITDSATGIVYRCDLDDLTVEPFITVGLKRPTGIAYNQWNRLIYVVDTVGAKIHAFDQSGRELFNFGGEGSDPGRFNHPTNLAIDPSGRVVVTDTLNDRIQIFTREGAFVKQFGDAGDSSGHFAKPKGVAVDSEGHIYVCDALFDAVQVFNDQGQLLMTFGSAGSAPGEFWMPSGIFIDKDDVVYVADTYNKRIQVLNYKWQAWTD